MPSVIYAVSIILECCIQAHYAECRYAERRGALRPAQTGPTTASRSGWCRDEGPWHGKELGRRIQPPRIQPPRFLSSPSESFRAVNSTLCGKEWVWPDNLKYFIWLITSYNWFLIIWRAWLLYLPTSYNHFIACCNTITNCFIIKRFSFSRYRDISFMM